MNLPLLFTILAISGLLYIWIGNRASKGVSSAEDYYLSGRNLTFFPLMMTFLATQVGGGTLIGAADTAYTQGMAVFFYPLGVCIGLIILGLGFGTRLRALNISTTAEIFEKVYKSKNQRNLASLLSIVSFFLILIGQCIALKKMLYAAGFESPFLFPLLWALIVFYTVMGGLKAVVNTDLIQAGFIIIVLFIAFAFCAKLSWSILPPLKSVSIEEVPWSKWLLMPLLFMLIEQDMGQRCFAAKKGLSRAALTAGVVLFFCSGIAIYFGLLASQARLPLLSNTSVLMESVKAFTTPTIATFFLSAIFMAVISTADSLLCSISSNVFCDFLEKRKIPENKKIFTAKLTTLLIGVGCLILSYFFDNVVSLLMLSYELSVCLLFVPTIAAILLKSPSKTASFFSILFGAAGFILFRIFEVNFPSEVGALLLSLSAYIGTYLLKRN